MPAFNKYYRLQYQVPQALVKNTTSLAGVYTINFCNPGPASAQIRIAVSSSQTGAGINAGEWIEWNTTLTANNSYERTGILVNSGDYLIAYSSSTTVVAQAWGFAQEPVSLADDIVLQTGTQAVAYSVPQTAQANVTAISFTPLTPSGGTPPYTYSSSPVQHPFGVSLNGSTGLVSGTPTTVFGQTIITYSVRDSTGQFAATTSTVTINVTAGAVAFISPSYVATSYRMSAVAYSPSLNRYLTVGSNTGNGDWVTFTSPGNNPTTWTKTDQVGNAINPIFTTIIWSSTLNLYVGMGYTNTGSPYYYDAIYFKTADGTTFTQNLGNSYLYQNVSTGTTVRILAGCISPVTGRIVGVGALGSSTYTSYYSTTTDATTWTLGTISSSPSQIMTGVACNSAGLFIAVGYENSSGAGLFTICSNGTGTTWTAPARFNGSATAIYSPKIATNSSGTWVAIGSNDSFNNTTMFSTTTDNGATWTSPAVMPGTTNLGAGYSIVWNSTRGYFVASIYKDGLSSVYYAYSTDGLNWSYTSFGIPSGSAYALTNGSGRTIAAVSGGGVGQFYQTWA
jgi:hypothetical protein